MGGYIGALGRPRNWPWEGCRAPLRHETLVCYRALASVTADSARLHAIMSVDADTVRRIAHLARIAVAEEEVEHLKGELNAILAFVEQLSEVNVDGVEPMTSVTPMEMKKRADVVTDGGIPDDIVRNAPAAEDHFFVVPKVVE
jgi:aspartyl-tRNA(Asn)/glutamyl-tRNA(Gln) amidotransferase subunit C